jgi:phosphoserine phosphatase
MKPTIKLCVFDFDSTLMDGETIDILAKSYGIGDEISRITHLTMAGELDFFESLTRRVSLLKGMSYPKVLDIMENLTYMPGARETIAELKKRGAKVLCFSGGFRIATEIAKIKLGFDADFANHLHVKDGFLTGQVGGDMMFNDSKGDMLLRMQSLLNISRTETMVVGDGANDLSMFAHADTRVAFCAKDVLKKAATDIIDTKDLTHILH